MKILILFSLLSFMCEGQLMAKSTLKKYRQRRALKKTSKHEPYGAVKTKKPEKPLFVVQWHDASHLHYDLRLEIDGVLKSWAVPKGIPGKQGIRRLAIPTDDHPMEYGHFEGIIPEGYGKGTVMVWDIGTFENIKKESISESYQEGTLEFFLRGKKLWGPYALVKTSGLTSKESWILLRMKSDKGFSDKRKAKAVPKNVSALTKRTMKKIATDRDAQWE
jgi:DNA ligase D-like protein (predicted 3'-phosphoesterase)